MNLCDAGEGIANKRIWKQSVCTLYNVIKDQSSAPNRELVCAGKCILCSTPHMPAMGLLGAACVSIHPLQHCIFKTGQPGKSHFSQNKC